MDTSQPLKVSDTKMKTNRLIHETSPYLRQHAHNPVDWYAWGTEALDMARALNRPVLLSIGYSACHWCHVMEHESFENESIAHLMNENFINIKVDREERPDLDQIYMNAVQMMTGHGGWPLTVFLTPALEPFFGGTYFPPQARYNMPGFPQILLGVAEAYRSRPEEIKEHAFSVISELRRSNLTAESREPLSPAMLNNAFNALARNYDPSNGGFGGAPKFPAPMSLEFALRQFSRTGAPQALDIVKRTCTKMAAGGVYDQLGGGFHRYSTDSHWLVPHFEKMLYDNALLSRLYLHAYQATGERYFREVSEETLEYVAREMKGPSGEFYSTQDADSEGEEGKFFVWTIPEVMEVLGKEDGAAITAFYGLLKEGNFEGQNILHLTRPVEELAKDLKVSAAALNEAIERSRRKLLEKRDMRIKPARDEKTITSWNGLMLTAFAEASAVLDRRDFRSIAEANAEFILKQMTDGEVLLRVFKDGEAKLPGYLDDYSFFASALVSLYEVTGANRWLEEAITLADRIVREFWDEASGGFFYTPASGEKLIVRNKEYFDNAIPSGNSVCAELMLRLSLLTGNNDYKDKALRVFKVTQDIALKHPSAFGYLLTAIDFHISPPKEIALIRGDDSEFEAMFTEIWHPYLPAKVVAISRSGETDNALSPLLQARGTIAGRTTAYVCQNYTCKEPVNTPEGLRDLLFH